MKILDGITDGELLSRLDSLSGKECRVIAEIVLHLHHVNKRGLYRDAGYSSLFEYCTSKLKYTVGAAYRRMTAAQALDTSPELYELLRDGKTSLCAINLMAKVITPENKDEVISKSVGKSKAEVELITLDFGKPEARKTERVRAKRVRVESTMLSGASQDEEEKSEKCYSVTIELTEEEMKLIQRGQKVTGKSKIKDVIISGVSEILRKEDKKVSVGKRKSVSTIEKNPPKSPLTQEKDFSSPPRRYIRASVQREVRLRDDNQCTYCSPDGHRCTERYRLEFDHVVPFALGGSNEADNLRLTCRAHNMLHAERAFGRERMQQYQKG